MARRRTPGPPATLAAVIVALALVAGCGGGEADEASGFRMAADQVVPATTSTAPTTSPTTAPAPGGEEVTVATAITAQVTVRCDPPPGVVPGGDVAAVATAGATVDLGNGCTAPAPPIGRPALSPIPGPQPNVVADQVPGGAVFHHPTYFGNPLVFTVVEDHGEWLRVMVPARPNGQLGWIRAADVELSTHRWRAEIDVTTNRLRVWQDGEVVADTGTVDGRPSSPTPLGRFYFNEKIEKYPSSPYGSWILSTSGYSDSLETFDGGLPVFAVHGTPDDSQIGTDISNGCVRIPNPVVEQLAATMPMGTPVDIVAS